MSDTIKQAEEKFLAAVSAAASELAHAIREDATKKLAEKLMASFKTNTSAYVTTSGTPVGAEVLRQRGSRTKVELTQQVIDFVRKHPGYRIEQINARLGTKTGDLAGQIRAAIQAKRLVTKGYGRARTYHLGPKA